MSTFSYIETFFFITLGITFGLIVLLVYHFKKSINTIEQKCDTMFDIVQNITKDLFEVKSNVVDLSSQIQKLESQQQQPISRQPFFPFMQSMSSPPFQNTNNAEKTITIQRNELVVEELPEEEEESDEESEDSESDEDDDESDNDNDDESKCSTKYEKIVVIDYELNTNIHAENMNSISEENNDIKIINIQDESEVFLSEYRNDFINQIFRTSELIDSNTYPYSLHAESTTSISNIVTEVVNEILENSISNSEPVSINTETLTINNIESELPPVLSLDSSSQSISHQIVVNKLNKIADIEFFDDSHSITSVSKTEKGEKNEKNEAKDFYKKMSIQELKQLVISKGLCSDASKFKKNELIRLLHNQ
jgi:hypothetical protein